MPARDPVDRFYQSIEQDALTGCWLWQGSTVTDAERGYEAGQFWDGKRLVRAHRWSYAYHVGAIPPKYQVYHTCGVGLCCRPEHLEAARANRRCAEKTECPAGHPYSGDNLYTHPTSGARMCRTCHRERARDGDGRRPPYWLRRTGRYRADLSMGRIVVARALGATLQEIADSMGTGTSTIRARLRSVAAPIRSR